MDALDLLSGDARTFVEKIWASHVHLHHTDPAQLVELLSFDDVDRLLTSTAIRTPAVRLAQDGSVLPAKSYTRQATLAGESLTGLIDARKVIDLFEGGATVVLQGLQRYWPPLTALVRDLELALGHPCQANAYLTPPGSQGFAVHSDSHDVFVFQTHGSKMWEVHPSPAEHPGDEVREVLLEPGLSMYLPTGTPHAARARDTVSLHVTVGVNQLTWRSVVDRAVRRALDAHAAEWELGGHLPAGYLADPSALSAGLADRLHRLADSLVGVDADAEARAHVDGFLSARPGQLRGSLVDRMGLDSIDEHTRLRRRAGVPCLFRPDGDGLTLLLGDRTLTVPARVRAAVEALVAPGEHTPSEAGMDPESNLVLSRRLVREGLLEALR